MLNTSCIEDRYKALCCVARSRSVISLGISCFKNINPAGNNQEQSFKVQTFNILLLCDGEYAVESNSLRFLVHHGFDFNKQYSHGIPYTKGNCLDADATPSVRQLFQEIILAERPLVLHNGFIDLIFMYQCFYAELPSALPTFVADLCEVFHAGIFDTKYISEYHSREALSFLEYLFRKCQHENEIAQKNQQKFIEIASSTWPGEKDEDDKEVVHCTLPTMEVSLSIKKYIPLLCTTFESRGFCPLEMACPKIHSVELIIASEDLASEKKKRKRKRKRKSSVGNQEDGADGSKQLRCSEKEETQELDLQDASVTLPDTDEVDQSLCDHQNGVGPQTLTKAGFDNILLPRLTGHRAGFDAFMTGYCFAHFNRAMPDCDIANKVYLTAKDVPLNVVKSHFAKTSLQHRKMMTMITGNE